MSKIDLHTHSLYSGDGEYSIASLFQKASKADVSLFSITDHNSILSAKEAIFIAQHYPQLQYVSGIEIDCVIEGIPLHILGYNIQYEHPFFETLENFYNQQEAQNSLQMISKIVSLGIKVDIHKCEQLAKNGIINAEMIAEVALADVHNSQHPLCTPYLENGARSDNPYVNFYWDLCSFNKPAYIPMEYYSSQKIIDFIHQEGGIAILAHPALNIDQKPDILFSLLKQGLDGIEAYSSYHTPSQQTYYVQWSTDHQLLITVGSDFHGKIKPTINIGSVQPTENSKVIKNNFIQALKKKV